MNYKEADVILQADALLRDGIAELERAAEMIQALSRRHCTLRDEAIAEIERWQNPRGDHEAQHIYADEALCNLLKELGYGDVVSAWEQVRKWYA